MKHNIPQNIDSERLSLKILSNEDKAFILTLTNSPGWKEFIGERNVHNLDDAISYIEKINKSNFADYWTVIEKNTGHKLGVITLIQREYLDGIDIGFAFLEEYAKKGFAYEASRLILDTLMEDQQRDKVYAITQKDNINSIKLCTKIGLQYLNTRQEDGKEIETYLISKNKYRIDQLTASFFKIFTNKNNHKTDWTRIDQLCIPETLIIKKTSLTQEVYNLDTFITPRRKILTDGTLTDFEEKEVESVTKIIGNIAQRASIYRKNGSYNGEYFNQTGNKFFQFLKTENGWKISSVLWED